MIICLEDLLLYSKGSTHRMKRKISKKIEYGDSYVTVTDSSLSLGNSIVSTSSTDFEISEMDDELRQRLHRLKININSKETPLGDYSNRPEYKNVVYNKSYFAFTLLFRLKKGRLLRSVEKHELNLKNNKMKILIKDHLQLHHDCILNDHLRSLGLTSLLNRKVVQLTYTTRFVYIIFMFLYTDFSTKGPGINIKCPPETTAKFGEKFVIFVMIEIRNQSDHDDILNQAVTLYQQLKNDKLCDGMSELLFTIAK